MKFALYRLFKDLLIYSVLDKLFTSFVHHLEEIKYLCSVGVVLFDCMSVIIRFRQRTENECEWFVETGCCHLLELAMRNWRDACRNNSLVTCNFRLCPFEVVILMYRFLFSLRKLETYCYIHAFPTQRQRFPGNEVNTKTELWAVGGDCLAKTIYRN